MKHWRRKIAYEIIVVDNGSNDGTREILESSFDSVRLIMNEKNVGFVKANNQGAKIARGRYLLLLNSDTYVTDDSVEKIVSYMDNNPDVGAATGLVLNSDGSFQRPFRRFPHPLGAFFRHTFRLIVGLDTPFHRRFRMKQADEGEIHEVDWLSGAYLFIRRDSIENGKVFDEDFFMYYEDTMLCFRIWEKGGRVVYLPVAPIIHYGGASAKQIRTHSAFNSFKGSVIYFAKTRGSSTAYLYSTVVRLAWVGFWAVFSVLQLLPIKKLSEKATLFGELFAYSRNR